MNTSRSRSLPAHRKPDLIEAIKEAAFAFAQCKVLARQSQKRGQSKLATLLEKTAGHYMKGFEQQARWFGLCGNHDHIDRIVEEESLVIEIVCKVLAREASESGEPKLARLLNKVRQDEAAHRTMITRALGDLLTKNGASARTGQGRRMPPSR